MKWISSYIPGKRNLRDILILILAVSLINFLAWILLKSWVPVTSAKIFLILLFYSLFFLAVILIFLFSGTYTGNVRYSEHSITDDNENIFEELSEISPVGMGVVCAKTGAFLYCNTSYEQYFGYERNELLKKKAPEIYANQEDREKILALLRQNNQVINYEVQLRRKDGSKFWSISSVKLIRFRNKPAYLGAFIDITKRKNAEESLVKSEQRLKSHLENSPLAIIEWGHDYSILQWSSEAEKIFGLKKSEVIGLKINELKIIYDDDIPIVRKTMERLSGGKEHVVVSENRNITRQGNLLNCIWYNSVLHDKNGNMSSVMSLVEDVTKDRRYEKMLKESEERFRTIAETVPVLVCITRLSDSVVLFTNEINNKAFGLDGPTIIGTKGPDYYFDPEDRIKMFRKFADEGFVDNYQLKVKRADGSPFWIMTSARPIVYEGSVAVIGASIDITDYKKTDEELKISEEKLWSVLNATQESVYMFDGCGNYTMANKTGLKRLGISEEKNIVGHNMADFLPPETVSVRLEHIRQVISNSAPVEFEDTSEGRMFAHSFFPINKNNEVTSVVAYSSDITERKKSEELLRESEERFRNIAERLPVLISIHNIADKAVMFINEAFERLFGYSMEELTPMLLINSLSDSNDNLSISEILRSDGRVFNREICIKSKDGQKYWLMTSIQKILFMNCEAYLTASINITDEKRAQDEIMKINRILNARSRSSQIMMHSRDEFGFLHEICKVIIEDCGHKMVWIGYARDDEKKSVEPVAYYGFDKSYIDNLDITWNDTERGQGPTGVAIRTGQPAMCRDMRNDSCFGPWRKDALKHGYAASLVIPLINESRAFGAMAIYSCETDPFSDSEIDLLKGLAEDLAYGISYLRLAKSEREAVAIIRDNEQKLRELVATKDKFFNIMAHDLKNPFTSLLGSSELLYENISNLNTDNIKELVGIINASAKSGFAILQNLLDWSRSQTGQIRIKTERLNIRNIVEENITSIMLQASNKNITLTAEIPDNIYVISDKNMINTALRNLLANAVKYSYKSGRINVSSVISDSTVVLKVEDNGTGIPAVRIPDLFRIDVSYSLPGTELEQGTGLGLKLCKEFIEKLGGKIWVESTEGKGSIFSFSIPFNCEFAPVEQLTEV